MTAIYVLVGIIALFTLSVTLGLNGGLTRINNFRNKLDDYFDKSEKEFEKSHPFSDAD